MWGTLALIGSGEYLPSMKPVDRLLLARLAGEARVVCLPTAAATEGAERIRYWSELGVRHFVGLGARAEAVGVIDRLSAHDASCVARVESANFVYLSGGKPRYLYDTLVGSPTWAAIMRVLEGGGVVAGCSAGAMICGVRSAPWGRHGDGKGTFERDLLLRYPDPFGSNVSRSGTGGNRLVRTCRSGGAASRQGRERRGCERNSGTPSGVLRCGVVVLFIRSQA